MDTTLFRWEHFAERLLRRLADAAGLPRGEAARALGERYGVPPGEEFAGELWPVLLEVWLAADRASAAVITARLRAQGLGDPDHTGTSAPALMTYLRGCDDDEALRGTVLAAFLAAGSAPTSAAAVSPRRRRSRKGAAREFRAHVEGLARELLGVAELDAGPDGAVAIGGGRWPSILSVNDDPERVRISSRLLDGAARTPELLEALNDLNADFSHARIFATPEGDVILALDLRGPDVRAADLAAALALHAQLVDTLADGLRNRFAPAARV